MRSVADKRTPQPRDTFIPLLIVFVLWIAPQIAYLCFGAQWHLGNAVWALTVLGASLIIRMAWGRLRDRRASRYD